MIFDRHVGIEDSGPLPEVGFGMSQPPLLYGLTKLAV
jgi:hypothetical protein